MSVPSSVEELLQLIRKSGMVEDQELNAYLARRQSGRGLPTDAREAADGMVRDGLLTYFQVEQFLLGKWRGFTIGKYKLLERVGVGGMGQVFLCEHTFMKRRVAIKVLPPAKAEQPAALGRFYREARAAGLLEHPNIVRTHDIDQDGNLHFIVMEYVDGSNLLDVVKKFGPMDLGRAAQYIRQVAMGLDFAFRNGIIHRDVKPGNVLIDRKGVARVLDMGLARFYKDQTDMLTVKYDDKIVLGTADYVAPEQVANSHAVDIRADIYALGASLYFLLAGHPPFPSGTVSQKLLWHRTKDPTPVRQIRPEVPEGLAAVVAKMMMKDPAARYQTPAEVVAELEKWVPAVVPLPAEEEMPQLSPAAMECVLAVEAEEPAPPKARPAEQAVAVGAGVGGGSGVAEARSFGAAPGRPPMLAPGPFAPPAGPRLDVSRSSVVQTLPQRPAGRPDAPPPRNPFAPPAHADVPTNNMTAQDPTPSDPRPMLRQPAFQTPAAPARSGLNARVLAFVSLVAASVVLGGGLVYWKMFKAPAPDAAPEPTVQAAQS
jgi:tRNA A-37 threonylcarbamoyl transferase component Bud32